MNNIIKYFSIFAFVFFLLFIFIRRITYFPIKKICFSSYQNRVFKNFVFPLLLTLCFVYPFSSRDYTQPLTHYAA